MSPQATCPGRPPPEDLGFGSSVRTGRGERLLNPDGTFTVQRRGLPLRAVISLSHSLMTMDWHRFLGLLAVLYVGLNGLFALGYLALGEGALEGPGQGFARAFFFSVQTATTIGYGQLVPASLGANLLATLEAFTALICFALSQAVHARSSYKAEDIVWDTRFANIFQRSESGNPTSIDIAHIDDLEPVSES